MIALLGVWLAAIVSPGPDLVQIIRVGAKNRRDGVLCALGIMAGNTVWIVASLAGLSALIQAFPEILSVLQVVGGAYLMWMGIGALRAGGTKIPEAQATSRPFLTGLRRTCPTRRRSSSSAQSSPSSRTWGGGRCR